MKVVVAGGSGLIGRALCGELRRRGNEPVVLSRHPERRRLAAARVVAWDPARLDDWTTELDGADAIINLAGENVGTRPWTPARMRALRDSRLGATRALVAALATLPAQRRPRVLVNASGTDLYEGRDAEAADEASPPADTFLGRLCAEWEAGACRAEALGVGVVLARIGLVIAPDAPALRLLALPVRAYLGGPVGTGRQWISWIDLADAVGLLLWTIDHEAIRGPVNIVAPEPVRQAEVAVAIAAVLGRPARVRMPAWLVRLALGDQAVLALGSRRVRPAVASASGYRFAVPSLGPALRRALGPQARHRPVS